jgi:hypothetical protein
MPKNIEVPKGPKPEKAEAPKAEAPKAEAPKATGKDERSDKIVQLPSKSV